MATGLAAGVANTFLDTFDGDYVQLHTGDPGAAGTSNVATETDRQQLSLGAASGGAAANDAALTWTSVAGSEDFTHWSLWSASTDGTFQMSGTVTANAVTAGDTFTIAIGDFDLSLTVAS